MRHRDDMVRTDQQRNTEGLMLFAEALGKFVGVELHRRLASRSAVSSDENNDGDRPLGRVDSDNALDTDP